MKTKAEFNEYPVTVYTPVNTHWETLHIVEHLALVRYTQLNQCDHKSVNVHPEVLIAPVSNHDGFKIKFLTLSILSLGQNKQTHM